MTHDVLIVGGGFAGMTAARELRRHGCSVLVLEARDRLGGRAWLKKEALGGTALEMGGAWIDPRETYVWAEAQRYHMALEKPIAGAWPSTWRVMGQLRHGALPIPVEQLRDIERLVVALNLAAGRVTLDRPLAPQGLSDLDIPLSAFIDQIGLPPEARDIAELKLRTYGSALESDISTLHLVRRIAAAGSVSELIMSASGFRMTQGTTALVERIAADAKADIHLSTPVRVLRQTGQGVRAETRSQAFEARLAIVAVPLNVWKDIEFQPALSEGKQLVSKAEIACTGIKVWAVVKGCARDFFAVGRGAGLDWLESLGTVVGEGVLMAGYGSDSKALDIGRRDSVQAAVRSFAPHAEVLEVSGHDWRGDPYSRETWAVFRPGQITAHEKDIRASEKRFIFAGSHTALRWTGFIDGAIESGIRASREALAALSPEVIP